MSIVAGCDVGSLTSKAVIMKAGRIIGSHIIKSKPRPQDSANAALDGALLSAGISKEDIQYCIGTGYGREKIEFVDEVVSEIKCHGKGARWMLPSAETVIDIGGQDCKTMKLDKDGNVGRFAANDKCASGTGRFLEVMAKVLGVSIDELGKLSAKAKEPITLASTCTVWAQADVIKYINSGVPIEDIGAGINTAMAVRVAILVNSVKPEGDIFMTGGVAKNIGVVETLEKLIGKRIKRARKADPQIAGALGAALIAEERGKREKTS
ncbi:MAG: 2-hydroxyglutaryl-CoA dehydratase [Desulfobacterales bacterium CG23_combo_of_CG06-09_8_20_14_all_51_8]|nr:MAG: 2-hydroxyglutaryl-CoA dehydratase [Desulfobacterales bacterium CG23_combo_of_CG06-09_8_20_14_all_51_8]